MSKLFGPPFCISILKLSRTQILGHSFDFNILKDQNVSQVNVLICKWRNTLRKEAQKKQPKKELIAREIFPTTEQILNFDKSEKVKNAKPIIVNSQVGNRFKMRMENYCEARDYLLTSLIFDNTSRPGAISNITLGEYKRATERDNGYVISVIKHKIAHKGPANTACTRSLFRDIGIYVKYL